MKNQEKKVKKSHGGIKTAAILTCLSMVAAFGGVTGAYLTDAVSKNNNITVGNIVTTLTEPNWDKNTEEDRTVWPGRVVAKDPTVTNTSQSSVPCFAYLLVTVPKESVRTYSDETGEILNDGQAVDTELVSYEINDGWTELEKYEENKDGSVTRVYAYDTELAPDESTVPLFDEIQYANVVEGDIEMDTVLNIPVQMVTIQSDWLSDGNGNPANTPELAYDVYVGL